MLNLEDWLDMHESPQEIGGTVCYVRSHDVAVLVDQIRREKAEPVSVQQDVEEFIRDNEFFTSVANPEDKDGTYSVSVYDLRAWMEGHVRVPVDEIETILEVVRGNLNEAYQNAIPVCCRKAGQQCCGNPVAEWNQADMALMDSLGPVEKTISAMLSASKERDNE